jgi:hypothetical protein
MAYLKNEAKSTPFSRKQAKFQNTSLNALHCVALNNVTVYHCHCVAQERGRIYGKATRVVPFCRPFTDVNATGGM